MLKIQLMLHVFRILIILIIFPREARATRCYQCDSKRDEGCTTNYVDAKYLIPCPSTQAFCRKAVYIYYFTDSREYVTVRECAKWRNVEKECYRGRYTRDSYQLVCECKGAGCNRSTRSFAATSVLLCAFCQFVILLVSNPT